MLTAKHVLLWILCCSIFACKPQADQVLAFAMRKGAIQEKDVNDIEVTVAYMPACWQHAANPKQRIEMDTTEMVFRVSIHPRYDGKPLPATDKENYNYGVDSLFALVTKTDTIPALYAHKVANGNFGGIEYLVGFNRAQVTAAPSVMLLFKDWLFTSTLLHFYYDRSLLEKVDALSCSI